MGDHKRTVSARSLSEGRAESSSKEVNSMYFRCNTWRGYKHQSKGISFTWISNICEKHSNN